MGSTLVLGSTAIGAGLLPVAAGAAAGQKVAKKPGAPAPLFDPTLENHPGYSARIAVPQTLKASASDNDGLNVL